MSPPPARTVGDDLPPTATRCPTCDREGCDQRMVPAVGGPVHDCAAKHRVDWRARALAAEALVASYQSPTCDHRHPCRCGSGGHPRRCERHPKAFDAHCAELNQIAIAENKLEEAEADAARWRKVAPLIDELSNARGLHRVHDIADQIAAATQEPTP